MWRFSVDLIVITIVNTVICTEGNFRFYQAIKAGPGDHLNICGGILLK
jgi:hypothetical protein